MNKNEDVKYTYALPIYNYRSSAVLKLIELAHKHAEFSTREVEDTWALTRWPHHVLIGFKLRDDQRFFKRTFWSRNAAEIHQYGLAAPGSYTPPYAPPPTSARAALDEIRRRLS
ncbi:hypothetical protein GOFOIKOB_6554 [Methylobacterium tardum]|uniref:Uncharacterized protein n=1 Tax=Methylobacterium tardum TaxID=374432 RepID=A0AA37TLS1_9HYPH|nr:hypothetical protein [Methylobacterium tardum]URD38738.1 hypothetical protein M6G65_10150 [Methylobacterium tardum]URD38778.1 hypothetical protein M6G65_10360 [Methylobacterium tardum]GJE53475.1 hypothetical protein GOFOIKOB_6554 [Methylobacterium tardum]GLS74617.1 hypothetical protein GCM10007890_66350 [Methylobacterium tardum]